MFSNFHRQFINYVRMFANIYVRLIYRNFSSGPSNDSNRKCSKVFSKSFHQTFPGKQDIGKIFVAKIFFLNINFKLFSCVERKQKANSLLSLCALSRASSKNHYPCIRYLTEQISIKLDTTSCKLVTQ